MAERQTQPVYNDRMSESGEIGIRAGFKFRCPQGLGGSIPPSRTNPFEKGIATIYGPYERSYGSGGVRRQIVIVFLDGTKTTMTYARWLMTQHLGRALFPDEQVDHINEDSLDDRIENLQILTRSANTTKSNKSKPSPLKGKEKGWKHGTIYGWMKKKCECSVCLTAKTEWSTQRNAKRRKK